MHTMAVARGDHIKVESDAPANELEKMMNSTNLNMSPGCCIFKVPNILRRHNPRAYAPNAFSIGPYHYGEEHLQATQKIKLKYLHDLISGFEDPKMTLRTLTGDISEVHQEARDCYAEPTDHISRDEFVALMVLDGSFLIELFRRNAKLCRRNADDALQKDDDPVFTRNCMVQLLNLDLILVENQIPWLVLERLFNRTRKPEETAHLSSFVLHYFYYAGIIIPDLPLFQQFLSRKHENKHVLDILRDSLVMSYSISQERNSYAGSMPSATRLREAGIKFKRGSSSKSILDIKFEDGVLEVPLLNIQEAAGSLFRNLICLEQCLPNCDPRVTSYAILLDQLIDTREDMEILCESGIIENWLNVDDATGFFNQLYHGTYLEEYYYTDLIEEVNKYCEHRWPRYRTVLMRDYFNHPWALVSVIAAAILLILTFLQTLFSIIK